MVGAPSDLAVLARGDGRELWERSRRAGAVELSAVARRRTDDARRRHRPRLRHLLFVIAGSTSLKAISRAVKDVREVVSQPEEAKKKPPEHVPQVGPQIPDRSPKPAPTKP
jgi:hypothetical protein